MPIVMIIQNRLSNGFIIRANGNKIESIIDTGKKRSPEKQLQAYDHPLL